MHRIIKRIYYHDTDCGGVVYYANYLKYFEEARTEFFAAQEVNLSKVAEEGFLFAVQSVEVSYKRPARYGQIVEVTTKITKARSASLFFLQTVELEDTCLVLANTKIVCINKDFKAAAIPESILSRIKNEL